jgi:hypothetical protein
MVLLVDVSQVEAHFGQFKMVLSSTQYWCMVCTECIIGSKIILDIVLMSMQYRCTIYAERAIVSQIVLGAPDRTR